MEGEHLSVAPELGGHRQSFEVEVGGVVGVSSVDPNLGAHVSLWDLPSGALRNEFRHDLRFNPCGALGSTALLPVVSRLVVGDARCPGFRASVLTILEAHRCFQILAVEAVVGGEEVPVAIDDNRSVLDKLSLTDGFNPVGDPVSAIVKLELLVEVNFGARVDIGQVDA